ncbi:metallophosphoesterase [Nocardia rhizosphaerihabitans]|uniref:metallophosphoesterase n=1 Tax=Nocardia rhizosphaerihabitans TaxID=1691570 RepID=UPI00366E21AD
MFQMLFVGAVLGLVHWLLYRRFAVAPGLGVAARRAVAVGLVLLWIPPFVAVGAGNAFSPQPVRPIVWLGEVWLAVLFYLGIGLIVAGLVLLVARLLKYQDRRRLIRVLSAVVIVAAVGTVAYGVVEANRLRVVEAELTFAQLPRQFDGLRVVVVADIHVGAARGADFTRRVVELVNEQQPDVIVLPGDLLDGAVEHVAADIDPLAGLRSEYGKFVVAGNHEGYVNRPDSWLDYYDRLGLTSLRNSRAAVTVGDASIDIAGVYDFAATDPAPDVAAALAGQEQGRFTVLLAHQPLQGTVASEHGVQLQLSGHTHGGQMWPLMYPVKWINGTVAGHSRVGEMQMFTTRGIGAWGPPVRVGAPPDISVLTLRAG